MDQQLEISIVAPVFNERDNLDEFISSVLQVMKAQNQTFELIIIDDGSTDGSEKLLTTAADNHLELRVLRLSRNFGQTAAIQAGFDVAKGKYLVTLDSDLQNDPKDITKLIKKLKEENLDLVVGWRKNRKDNFFLRNFPSRVANLLIGRITKVKLNDYGCSLKAYNSEILREVKLFGEMHRFIPAWMATKIPPEKISEVEVEHHARVCLLYTSPSHETN